MPTSILKGICSTQGALEEVLPSSKNPDTAGGQKAQEDISQEGAVFAFKQVSLHLNNSAIVSSTHSGCGYNSRVSCA